MMFYSLFALLLAPPIEFTPVPDAVDFVLEHFPTALKYLPETMAGGLALFDYNRDGRVDLFFANGASLDSGRKAKNRLYRNEGGMRFTDVTAEAGLAGDGFAFGAAAGDFDGDGWVDLFVPAMPTARLYRNRGDGRFEDVTAAAGLKTGPWAVAAAWVDSDRDGRLDLFVVNYLDWSKTNHPWCGDRAKDLRVYCHPRHFKPLANTLYRNTGGGRFADVSESAGIRAHPGKGMSAAVSDADGDGWPDVFVTNDGIPNSLFLNQRNGRFVEGALAAGVSLRDSGKPVSSMGVDFRDVDNDGHDDVVVTALAREGFSFFRNLGKGTFIDATETSRLASLSLRFSGWGIAAADLDNDGYKDLVTCNSHVNDLIEATSSDAYRQPITIFRNSGGAQFAAATLGTARAYRGCAVADLDNDGKLDLVSTALGEHASIWRNTSPGSAHWLDIEAPLGTIVSLGNQRNSVTSSVGYSSSSLIPAHFGLGAAGAPVDVRVQWPDGSSATRQAVPEDRRITLRQ